MLVMARFPDLCVSKNLDKDNTHGWVYTSLGESVESIPLCLALHQAIMFLYTRQGDSRRAIKR